MVSCPEHKGRTQTVDMDHVSLIPGLVDAWGPSGTVGLFHFPFVWTVGYIS